MALTKLSLEVAADGSSIKIMSSDGVSPITLLEFDATGKCIGGDFAAAVMAGGFEGGLTGNDYVKLPNGLILQWGTSPVAVSGTLVTLPITFPNAFFHVGAGREVAASSAALYCYINSLSDFYLDYSDATASTGTTWMAIGW